MKLIPVIFYCRKAFPIGENETAGEVHDKMKEIGAQLLVKTVKGLAEGTLKETPQSSIVNSEWSMENPRPSDSHSPLTIHHSPLKHAPKIFTETLK